MDENNDYNLSHETLDLYSNLVAQESLKKTIAQLTEDTTHLRQSLQYLEVTLQVADNGLQSLIFSQKRLEGE